MNVLNFILKKRNLEHDELREYLNEAFKFCEIRKFDFIAMKDCEANFSFDFVKGDRNNFNVDPKEIHNNVNIRFYYKDEKNTFTLYEMELYYNSYSFKFKHKVTLGKNYIANTPLNDETKLKNNQLLNLHLPH